MKVRMEFNYTSTLPYFNLLVPTNDTVRFSYMIEHLINY